MTFFLLAKADVNCNYAVLSLLCLCVCVCLNFMYGTVSDSVAVVVIRVKSNNIVTLQPFAITSYPSNEIIFVD